MRMTCWFTLRRAAALVLTLSATMMTEAPAGAGRRAELVRLGNGLEIVLLPDPASRLVTSVMVVRAGSNRETPATSGAAHFLEHLLFNGTDRRTQKELYDAVDGAGGFNNAFTRRTHAAFMMTVPVDYMSLGLDLQADMLFHSRLQSGRFEKERRIILEELAKDRESEAYELERILEAETYPNNSYGLPVLGTETSLARLDLRAVGEHYRRLYVPQNLTGFLIGGFDPDSARAALERTFGDEPGAPEWVASPEPPAAIEVPQTIRHDLATSRSRVRMVWNAPAPGQPGFRGAQCAAEVFLSGMSAPLGTALQERFQGAVQGVAAWIDAGPGFGRLILDLDAAPGTDLGALRDAVMQILPGLGRLSEARLAAWKVSRQAEQIFAEQRSYMLAPVVSEDVALFGITGLQSRLEECTALDCNEVSSAYRAAVAGPCRSILVRAVPDHAGRPLSEGPPGSAESAGAGRDDPAGSAEFAGPQAAPYPFEERRLDNGANLLLLRAPADGSLSIYLLCEGRNYLEPEGREGITELLHGLLTAGAGDLDEGRLREALEGIGAEVQTADQAFIPFDDYYTRADFSFVRMQALEAHAPRAFELLGLMLREPRCEPAAVERERGRALGRLRREAGTASSLAQQTLRDLLHGEGHAEARSPYGTIAGLSAVTREDLLDHRRRLFDPRRLWIAVVTSLPADEVAAMASALTGGPADPGDATLGMGAAGHARWLERATRGARARARLAAILADPSAHGFQPAPAGDRAGRGHPELRESDPAGGARQAWVLPLELGGERGYVLEAVPLPTPPPGSDAVGERSAREVAAGVLSSRLAFDLREGRGLAYGIGAALQDHGGFDVYVAAAGTRLENVAAMTAGLAGIRQACAEGQEGMDLAPEAHRTAASEYGRALRRQEMRLNQAMFAVWSRRRGQSPDAWWREATALRSADSEKVRAALTEIGAAPALLIAVR